MFEKLLRKRLERFPFMEMRTYWSGIRMIAYDTVNGRGDITLHVPKRRRYPVKVTYHTAEEPEITRVVQPGNTLYIGNKGDSEIHNVRRHIVNTVKV